MNRAHRIQPRVPSEGMEPTELVTYLARSLARITSQLLDAQAQLSSANAMLEKKVEERTELLRRGKGEWERTFDAIAEPIALQSGFVLRRVNAAYARQVAIPLTRIPGQTCFRLLAGRSTPCLNCPLARERSQALSCELAISGSSILKMNGYWVNDDPGDDAVVVHYQDVTHQRVLAAQLRERERLAAVGELAAGAAHEINNPLGFIQSNLSSLREAIEKFGNKELVDMIDDSLSGVTRVASIVSGLRELARLDTHHFEPCCVSDSVARALRNEFEREAQRVHTQLEATAYAAISPLHLDQALGHILRNARQAVSGDQRVFVRTTHDADEVRVEVQDEGPGIPAKHLGRIFEPFFTTRGASAGVGLGLTAAHGIVTRVGGIIEVHSECGRGATFVVRVPRADAAPQGIDQGLASRA